MSDPQLSSIEQKLDLIISLLMYNVTSDQPIQSKVELLASFGLKSTQIAKILGKSSGNIDKVLSRIKKKKS